MTKSSISELLLTESMFLPTWMTNFFHINTMIEFGKLKIIKLMLLSFGWISKTISLILKAMTWVICLSQIIPRSFSFQGWVTQAKCFRLSFLSHLVLTQLSIKMVVSSVLILMTAKPCFSQLRAVVIHAGSAALKCKPSVLNASGPPH